MNGQCLCLTGYYSVISEIKCLSCDKLCRTCYGPTVNDCLECNSNFELFGSTCKCLVGYF